MSKLTDLRAALDAKREAGTALRVAGPKYKDLVLRRAWTNRRNDLYDLLIDNTIRALLDVAEAANELCHGGTFPKLQAALAPLVKEADHE